MFHDMKIAIFTNEEYSFLFDAWRRTIPELRKSHEIAGIWVFPELLKDLRGFQIPLWYLRTFGLVTVLQLVIRSVATRLRVRGTYESTAREFGIAFHRGKSPNAPETVAWVRDQGIDVIFIALGNIIKAPLIEAARVGVVNKHSALLPAYRGLLPMFWTLLDGRTPAGVTVHKIDVEIDHGEVLVQRAYPGFPASVYDGYRLIYRDMPDLLLAALRALETGERTLVDVPREASYRSLPTRDDVKAFRSKGLRFV